MVHMEYYLVVSTFMMFAGIYGFFTRRNLLAMLISVELILNSVDINFAVFNRYLFPEELEGFFFALFAIGVSAAETAVAIAIIINIYRNVRNIQVRQSFLQRMFNVGWIGISSAGQSGVEIEVNGIPDPERVKEIIDEHRNA